MQAEPFESFLRALSTSRLAPYHRDDDGGSELTIYSRYLGKEDWFEDILADPERKVLEVVKVVKERLKGQKIALDMGQLVANSSFGFWVSLFNSRYENILWPQLLADVFPFMPKRIRKRRTISGRLNGIRGLRNRVFHYEPIWHRANLLKQHDEIIKTIA